MQFDNLPFVNVTNGVRNNWCVVSSGNYAVDCQTGAEYFQSLKRVSDMTNNPQLIQYVMQDIVRAGQVNGIEVGFITALTASLA